MTPVGYCLEGLRRVALLVVRRMDVLIRCLRQLPVVGQPYDSTTMILPIRGHLDSAIRLMKGDMYIGRGSQQRCRGSSRYCNPCKVAAHGGSKAIANIERHFSEDVTLRSGLWSISDNSAGLFLTPTIAVPGTNLPRLYRFSTTSHAEEKNNTATKGPQPTKAPRQQAQVGAVTGHRWDKLHRHTWLLAS